MHSQRVRRLVRLREQQHLLTAMQLRSAQHCLHREDEALANIDLRAQTARDDLYQSQQSGVVHDWLLACADAELCKVAAAHHSARRVTAQQGVQDAAQHESTARMASKQMEHTFESVRRDESRSASRAEQLYLDEAVRNLRSFSKKPHAQGSPI